MLKGQHFQKIKLYKIGILNCFKNIKNSKFNFLTFLQKILFKSKNNIYLYLVFVSLLKKTDL